jgi:hypothetical protein
MSYPNRYFMEFRKVHVFVHMSLAAGIIADIAVIYFALPGILLLVGKHMPLSPWPTIFVAAVAFIGSFSLAVGSYWKCPRKVCIACLVFSLTPVIILYLMITAAGPGINDGGPSPW